MVTCRKKYPFPSALSQHAINSFYQTKQNCGSAEADTLPHWLLQVVSPQVFACDGARTSSCPVTAALLSVVRCSASRPLPRGAGNLSLGSWASWSPLHYFRTHPSWACSGSPCLQTDTCFGPMAPLAFALYSLCQTPKGSTVLLSFTSSPTCAPSRQCPFHSLPPSY